MSPRPEKPTLLCYDGSEDAGYAIECSPELLSARPALVLTVWQPTAALGSFAWSGATAEMVDFAELDRAGAEDGGRIAEEGVQIARRAGMDAQPIAVEAAEPTWKTITAAAEQHDAAVIVMGSRGLTGLRAALLGTVSGPVVHHSERPTLVIPRP